MTDQADRERESRESDTTKFEDIRREDESERERIADDLASEQLEDAPDRNEA
jgi:hypothetical protein